MEITECDEDKRVQYRTLWNTVIIIFYFIVDLSTYIALDFVNMRKPKKAVFFLGVYDDLVQVPRYKSSINYVYY